jgi:hypothetical protein
MKHLFSLIAFMSFTFLYSQTSDQEIKFDDYTIGYSKIGISFGGKYNENVWEFKNGNQYIKFTPDDLEKAAVEFENAYNKAVEWDKIADDNDVNELIKEIPFSFFTTRGMIEEAGYESVGSMDGKFEFQRGVITEEITSFLTTRVYQHDEYFVRSAFFNFPAFDIRKNEEVEKFIEFLDFIKNNKSIIEEKIKDSKSNLFN